jgi:thioredoxin 1
MKSTLTTSPGMNKTHVQEFTDANYEREVLASPLPTLVDFTAAWCGPCRALKPTIAALAEDHAGRLKVGMSDVDVNQVFAARYGVRNMPTLLLFVDGQVVAQIVGAVPRAKIEAKLEKWLSTPTRSTAAIAP